MSDIRHTMRHALGAVMAGPGQYLAQPGGRLRDLRDGAVVGRLDQPGGRPMPRRWRWHRQAAARGATAYVTLGPAPITAARRPAPRRWPQRGFARRLGMTDPIRASPGGHAILRRAASRSRRASARPRPRALQQGFLSPDHKGRADADAETCQQFRRPDRDRHGESQWITGPEARATFMPCS